jgi:hypothetical protein
MQEDQRDDVPRIHLDSIKNWECVKSNVKAALNEILERSEGAEDNEAIITHLNRVRSRLNPLAAGVSLFALVSGSS